MSRFSVVSSGEPSPEETAGPALLAALLRRAAGGDEAAFAELYDEVSPRLYGLVRRVVRDPAQSEEVAQEVFLEIWRHSARFDPARGSALSWMMTIAHRRAVDRVRSAEAARGRDDSYGAATHDVSHDSTAEAVVQRLDAERVHRALDTLTEAQRGALELAYLSGYTHTEVATLLDLPLGTAKTRIRDGLIRLRDTLGVTS
ncbi:RNA polymerase sigma factor SigK [Intrasporangium oryzae NRRL B-24470]|uniref:RNA polymerase sigma factor SigK n=1 Tax=Intrasporangium oryzae NRRL B-24470 TaxID=1386089 RepID=W9G5B1_9MICO|nr:ECF RNA polymerase sigma factor SigK [Intrasporangium oryzae]EWT01356.1 RNA polymerase sigma factor SigK [Intrasporangium oryzae NRRL B-24470]